MNGGFCLGPGHVIRYRSTQDLCKMRMSEKIFFAMDLLFRSLCNNFRAFRDFDPLSWFKGRSSNFCVIISARLRSSTSGRLQLTPTLFINNIKMDHTLARCHSFVSRCQRNMSTFIQSQFGRRPADCSRSANENNTEDSGVSS
jgi:hypothetical protein